MRRLLSTILLSAAALAAQTYDIVLRGGRVIDPESKLDAVRDVGIQGGRIAAIAASGLSGRTVIDARGLVAAPGFIDLHSHGQDEENYRFKATDGVTTALEMEVGTADVDAWYAAREGKRLVHSGVTVGHVPSRMLVMRDPNKGMLPSGDGARKAATPEEILAMRRLIEQGLAQGALGVGFGIQYTPAASRWEILEMFRAARKTGAAAFVHLRYLGEGEPTTALNALEEVIAASAITGAPLHVVHITSSGLKSAPQLLQTIGEARGRGLDITTEMYPYNAGATELQSALFDEGWQKVLGVDYDALEWAATGERLTAESFARYRKTGGMVINHTIPGAVVFEAMRNPLTMIASDGLLVGGKGHPRAAGSYARVLGHYVRETGTITLMEALGKMSLMPAMRLEGRVPAMKNKGRIRVGADADVVVFDPRRVIDKATFARPAEPSEGIQHVLVSGVPVVRDGKLQDGVYPGRAVRAR